MPSFEFSGTAKFDVLAMKLRAAEKELRIEMGRALASGARPLPEAARRSAIEHLPKRGGLNMKVASARFRTRQLSNEQVDVVAKGIDQLADTNEGRITHPTYGHRPRRTQLIPKARGWFTQPMRRGKRRISNELGDAMHRVAKRIT